MKVYQFVRRNPGWHTNIEIARASGVEWRTARRHTMVLAWLGVFDSIIDRETHAGFQPHLYRIATSPVLSAPVKQLLARLDALAAGGRPTWVLKRARMVASSPVAASAGSDAR
jgi:hypothetical protein